MPRLSDHQPDLLSRAARRAEELRVGYRANGTWSPEPVDLVAEAARLRGAHAAVIERSGAVSYAALDRLVEAAAAVLASHGVGDGAPVLLAVGNDLASVVAVHAVLRLDAVVLVAPRNAGAGVLADIAARTGAELGVATDRRKGHTELGNGVRWLDLSAALAGDAQVAGRRRPTRPADQPSFVLFTSGTTSKPKGVIHSVATLMKASANYIAAAGLNSDDRLFLVSPMASVTGVLQALLIAPMLAAPVILEDRWSPDSTYELLVASGATWYGGPDRLLDRLLDRAQACGGEVPLRAVYLGGTMLERRIAERIERDFGIVVMRAYGSSEVPISTSGLRDDPVALRHADDGVPLNDVELRIGSQLDPGECCIRGPHTFLGYTDTVDDEHALQGGWFHTGDVAELRDGRVRIVGRLRDVVIRNGLKVPVAEVEEAMNRVPGIHQLAGYAVPDDVTGERLAVAVVLEPGAEVTLAAVLDALAGSGLAKYKLPEELVFWNEALPMNANGKVEKAKLAPAARGRPRQRAGRLTTK